MRRIAMWWQSYRDHGLPGKLGIYAVLSFVLAAITWLIPHNLQFMPVGSWLAIAWLVVVITGTIKCGWPALILWLPIYWALYWPVMTTLFVGVCLFGSCILYR